MPNQHTKQRVEKLGYCCIVAFFMSAKDENHFSTAALARELRISERAVRDWKRKIRRGEYTCQAKDTCYLAKWTAKSR